jgi:hypothetical protein
MIDLVRPIDGMSLTHDNLAEGAMIVPKHVQIEVEQLQYNELGPSSAVSKESFRVTEGDSFADLRIRMPLGQPKGPILKLLRIEGAEHATVALTHNLTASAIPSPKDMTYAVTSERTCHRVGPVDGGGSICLRIVR